MQNWLTRRKFLLSLGGAIAASGSLAGYGFAIEPYRLQFPHYPFRPAGWPDGLKLRIAVIADLHTCKPWMTAQRVREIVVATNAQRPDVVVLLGDFVTSHRFVEAPEDKSAWTRALAELEAPLGVHAILGNHDWWEDPRVQQRGHGPTPVGQALEAAGIPVYENDVQRLVKDGHGFWLAGLGDQWAFNISRGRWRGNGRRGHRGVDDLTGTLGKISDNGPVIMMAHEPDIFAEMPDRVALTLSGHTHGGQIQLFGYAPIVPSAYGRRYVYGHVRERERDLIVSGGLGCSGLPVRFGRPPEVPILELG